MTATATKPDLYETLAAHGWTLNHPSYGSFNPYTSFTRGKGRTFEMLSLRFVTNSRVSSGTYSRPRRNGEVDDLPENSLCVPTWYTRNFPRKGATEFALGFITAARVK
jgi:hypothetical protein